MHTNIEPILVNHILMKVSHSSGLVSSLGYKASVPTARCLFFAGDRSLLSTVPSVLCKRKMISDVYGITSLSSAKSLVTDLSSPEHSFRHFEEKTPVIFFSKRCGTLPILPLRFNDCA